MLSFIAELVMASCSGALCSTSAPGRYGPESSPASCWFGFVLTTVATNNAYPGRKTMLTVIDAGHWLGVLVIIGAILGGFGPR